ncbi:SDR family oxidoreductase [Devosia sp. PTR5]|uniref:SDR family oxidoreductase n=1 Tax=Devosia oryzisoli TaxID=2774138 RepID=A0A927FQU6_9HYPH|nr:SDR family oxidoreductase [Devosia oryzisoli]MBD8064346.1 SDR family oxidoreductase [Devosia oryzisoli]
MSTFLIIGATGGIGRALARRLRTTGHDLHLLARDATRLAELAEEIGASQEVVDVTDSASLTAAITAAPTPLAGLAYCVGTITLRPLAKLTLEDFRADFLINAAAAAISVQAALPALRATGDGASVVLFSSVAVSQGFTGHASIAMAKGAVEGLTRSLAAELAPVIRVNAVAPSLTRTPLTRAMTENEPMAKAIAGLHALNKLGEAEDIAAAAQFLLSPEAAWITGQVIGVDGGRSTLRTKG